MLREKRFRGFWIIGGLLLLLHSGVGICLGACLCQLPIAPPTDLIATASSPYQIDLDWMYETNDAKQYRVLRSPNGTDSWVSVAEVYQTGPTIHYEDTTLPPG